MREFLHVDDMAEVSVFVMNLDNDIVQQEANPMLSHINVGTGFDCTIRKLLETFAKVIGYQGGIVFNASKPDGAPRKLIDVSRIARLGWKSKINLEKGLNMTYQWFIAQKDHYRD